MAAGNHASASEQKSVNAHTHNARQLVLLGIVLQALHILFGITAIIGVLVTQTRIGSTQGSVYESQLRWQFVTFWIGLAGYAIGFYVWASHGSPWLVLLVLFFLIYRLVISAAYWRAARALRRKII